MKCSSPFLSLQDQIPRCDHKKITYLIIQVHSFLHFSFTVSLEWKDLKRTLLLKVINSQKSTSGFLLSVEVLGECTSPEKSLPFLRIYANRTSTEVSSCKLNMRFFGLNLSFVSFESSKSSDKIVTEGQGPEISPLVTLSMTPSYFERNQKQKEHKELPSCSLPTY